MRHAIDRRSPTRSVLTLVIAGILAVPAALSAQKSSPTFLFAIPNGTRFECSPLLDGKGYGSGTSRYFFWTGNPLAPDREVYLDVSPLGAPLHYFDWSTAPDSSGTVYVSGGVVAFATDSTPAEGWYARIPASELASRSARDSSARAVFTERAARPLTEFELHIARQVAAFFYRARCPRPSPPSGDASPGRTSL